MLSQPQITIDLRIADAPGMERSGVGRYALEVARGLQDIRPEWRLTLLSNRAELLEAGGGSRVRSTRWPTSSPAGRIAWLHTLAAVTTPRPDVWFGPAFVLPLWWRGPSVVTVHDLTFDLMAERYRGRLNAAHATRASRWSARRADLVLCGSEATRSLLSTRVGVSPRRVRVTPYGVAAAFRHADDPGARRDDFVLFVGSFEARKGLDLLLAALPVLETAGQRPPVVLAGRLGWGAAAELEALGRDDRVRVVANPSDEELAELYRRAAALVHPSRMEGFGLPVAEAMACGCPVVASDLPSVREFAGDVPSYFPPGDPAALAARLGDLLSDRDARGERGRAGRAAVEHLTWRATAEATARAIQDVLDRSTPG